MKIFVQNFAKNKVKPFVKVQNCALFFCNKKVKHLCDFFKTNTGMTLFDITRGHLGLEGHE